MPMVRNPVRLLSAGALVLSLAACKDYPAVSSASSTMTTAVSSIQPMSDDILGTCQRRIAIETTTNGLFADCTDATEAHKDVDAAITVLNKYFDALAAIASDDKWTVDKNLGALGDDAAKLVKASNSDKAAAATQVARATAITGLARVLATGFEAAKRQKALDAAIDHIDAVVILVEVLRDSITVDYAGDLALEGGRWRDVLSNAAGSIALPPGTSPARLQVPTCLDGPPVWPGPSLSQQSVTLLIFEKYYGDQCAPIVARRAAAAKVKDSAQSVIDGLRLLQKNRGNLKAKATATLLAKQAGDLAYKVKAAQDAFKAAPAATSVTAAGKK